MLPFDLRAPAIVLIFSAFAFSGGANALAAPSPIPALPPSFTLTYSVTQMDARTPAAKAKSLQNFQNTYARQVAQGTMSQATLAALTAGFAAKQKESERPTLSQITLSGDGDKLLYKRDQARQSLIVLYDGKTTDTYDPTHHEAAISRGFATFDLVPCPLPAASLPYLPLMKSPAAAPPSTPGAVPTYQGSVPYLEASSGHDVNYFSGQIQTTAANGEQKISSLTVLSDDGQILGRWDYLQHQRLGGVWIASRMRFTEWTAGAPARVSEYVLQSARLPPASAEQFDLTCWLAPRAKVSMETDQGPITFAYDSSGGSLAHQASATQARAQQYEALGPQEPLPVAGEPEREFQTVDMAGRPVSLSQYRGKVVLLDFWATWCAPCVAEIPRLAALYRRYHAEGFEIISLSADCWTGFERSAAARRVNAVIARNHISWAQVLDESLSVGRQYGPSSYPYHVVIGRDGKIAAVNPDLHDLATILPAQLKALPNH